MTARPLAWRGVVEGFYGEPWSHADRLAWFDRAGALGLDHYVYAPKDDPWHREEWREPYPADRLASLASLAAAAEQRGVRFVYAISPGLSMRYDDPEEHRTLAAKCRQLLGAGIHSVALLFELIRHAGMLSYCPRPLLLCDAMQAWVQPLTIADMPSSFTNGCGGRLA